ncbi:hypothetical protein MXB_3684, partial [Myxobolus squamalis]
MSDFDLMMKRKRSIMTKKKKKNDIDYLTSQDDRATKLVQKMLSAAEEDRAKNELGEISIVKLKLLPTVRIELQ